MANPTTNFGWQMPTSSDLVTDLPADFEVFGQAVDTALVDLKGGTTGQVLSKTSNTDMDFTWVTTDDANAIQNAIVDAKGDLIAASAADTPARLAVGSNGETLVADSSTATGLRWQGNVAAGRNVLINGNYDIWQRGATFAAATAGAYTADRFSIQYGGTSINPTVARDTTVPNAQSKYSAKVTQVTSSATSVTTYALRQSIEANNLYSLIGKSVTVSFWYRSNKTGSHGIRIYGAFLTGGTDDRQGFTVNAADTWEKKTITSTAFAAVSAINVSPEAVGGLIDIGFRVQDAGFTSVSASDYFQIAQVQLEVGSVATPFSLTGGTIQGELAACQRYYYRDLGTSVYAVAPGYGYAINTNSIGYVFNLPVSMRVVPTAIEFSGMAVQDSFDTLIGSLATITLNTATSSSIGCALDITKTSAFTAGRTYRLLKNNNTANYIAASAEL